MLHPHKCGKVRRVLNGAAKFRIDSKNNALLTGPDLLQTLIHVLMRFQQHPYAVFADIEGMFLQVGMIPRDRPSLGFLWREYCVPVRSPHFWFKGFTDLCQLCASTIARDNRKEFPETAKGVENNFYIDDYFESSATIDEATKKAQDLVKVLSKGGFTLSS